jgi:hypothetical protein
MPSISRPAPIPSQGVEAGDVATSVSRQLRVMGQATAAGAGLTGAVRTVAAAASIASTDFIVLGDTTSAGFTLTLPKVGEYSRNFWLVLRSAGANTLTLASRSGETINGAASIAVTSMVIVYATSNTAWTATTIG